MSAHVQHFLCPGCGARLKIQPQRRLDRQLPCPECRQLLHFQTVGESDEIRITPVVAATPRATDPPASDSSKKNSGGKPRDPVHSPSISRDRTPQPTETRNESAGIRLPARPSFAAISPFRIVVILATLTALVLIAVAARVLLEPSKHGEDPLVAADADGGGKNQEGDPVVPADAPPIEEGQGGDIAAETVDRRLERLGDQLDQYVESRSEFPAGAFSTGDFPIPQRFSWLATLEDQRQAEVDVSRAKFDRPWNDPLNDRFVRRRIAEFQNPQIVELAGEDGYPATHFVGLAGIGPEALRPNAPPEIVGMFPLDRGIKPTDVRDGLSQTILVCGVTRHLGAWAAAGPATVRAVTGNPIVGGPDGFGTGDADGMFVLMADGRVDRISADIDPAVFRRLVAIADEVTATPAGPPTESVSEESRANEPSADVEEEAPHKEGMDEEMADKEGRSDPPEPGEGEEEAQRVRKIDIAEALAIPILRFEQASKKRSVALLGVEELLGVPIRYNREELGTAAESLDGKVTLSLRKTTVGGVLDGILSSTGLTYLVEPDHIRITLQR